MRVERWSESAAPEADELRRRMLEEGYRVFMWSDSPGTTYDTHTHTENQSHWIVSGALELRIGSDEYILRAGDRDFLPAHTAHSAFVPGDEPVVYLIGARD